jgi:hypothetical protein
MTVGTIIGWRRYVSPTRFADRAAHRLGRTPAEYAARCSHTHYPAACEIN